MSVAALQLLCDTCSRNQSRTRCFHMFCLVRLIVFCLLTRSVSFSLQASMFMRVSRCGSGKKIHFEIVAMTAFHALPFWLQMHHELLASARLRKLLILVPHTHRTRTRTHVMLMQKCISTIRAQRRLASFCSWNHCF